MWINKNRHAILVSTEKLFWDNFWQLIDTQHQLENAKEYNSKLQTELAGYKGMETIPRNVSSTKAKIAELTKPKPKTYVVVDYDNKKETVVADNYFHDYGSRDFNFTLNGVDIADYTNVKSVTVKQ
jgi:hypothetical protein